MESKKLLSPHARLSARQMLAVIRHIMGTGSLELTSMRLYYLQLSIVRMYC